MGTRGSAARAGVTVPALVLALVMALVAAGCTVGGTAGTDGPARGAWAAPTSTVSPPPADPSTVLGDGIAGLRERGYGFLTHTALYEGAAYVDVRGGYRLDDPGVDLQVRTGNPLNRRQQVSGRMVVRDDDVWVRGFRILEGACWVEVPERYLERRFGQLLQTFVGDVDLLDRMRAVRYLPTSQVVVARLPAAAAWRLFSPAWHLIDLGGTVPVEVTVVDGVVLEWVIHGPDLWAAIERERPSGWRELGFVWDATVRAEFEDLDPGEIEPPDDDLAGDAPGGCSSTDRDA